LPRSKTNPHPFVTDLKANASHPRRARWVDPISGRKRVFHLPEDGEAAAKWMSKKSAELLGHRARTEPPPGGGPLPLQLMIDKYMLDQHRSRPGTLKQYGWSLAKFQKFVGKQPITQTVLWDFRSFVNQQKVSPSSVNRDLRHVKAFLRHARKAGGVLLSSEQISDGLELLVIKGNKKKKPLSRAEIAHLQRVLIEAADPLYYKFVMVTLLTGMRREENERLEPSQICGDLRIELGDETKTHQGRVIDFDISPTVPVLLGKNFKGWKFTADQLRARRNRIHPWVTFQRLRVTCGTYLVCAPNIWSTAGAYRTAKRLGHSVEVSEKHYMGVISDIPHDAKTLEAAMGLAPHPTAAE